MREDNHPANHRWRRDGENLVSDPVSPDELQALRDKATANKAEVAIRSCWLCNGAHYHFLDGEWGNWILCCLMGCGAYYYDRTDVTDYSPSV